MLLYATVSCILLGASSAYTSESECYGSSLTLPFRYSPPLFNGQLYFTPSKMGSRKLLMDKGEAKDPRIKLSYGSVKFIDLTERDDGGMFSVSFDGTGQHDVVRLEVKDCAQTVTQYYGDIYSCPIPGLAEFLEFTPLHSMDQPKVLWNRTDPQTSKGGKGRIKRNGWEIRNLNQADMGHYNVRAKDNTLLSRTLLTVKEHYRIAKVKVNERLFIKFPSADTQWTLIDTPEGGTAHILIDGGRLMRINNRFSDDWSTPGRIEVMREGIAIDPVKNTDSGTFSIRDPQGHLAKTVTVVVEHEPVPTFVYVGITVAVIIALIFCCCCVKKCCCKKSSSKRDVSAPQTVAAPAVYHCDNQPAGRSYSAAPAPDYSYQPMNSMVSQEPTNISSEPSYNPVNIHVNHPQLEVTPLGGQGVDPAPLLGSDRLSSDPEPKFELKGLPFPVAPPLSSDSTFCNVYTSAKLNFSTENSSDSV